MRALDAVVGMGSNMGDRVVHLRSAVRSLETTCTVVARSSIYETAPIGPPQPDYLNAAVRIRTDGTAADLLETLLAIEQQGGRVRRPESRWGPRTIDLDILWVSGVVLLLPMLTVPHPRLHERAFALLPFHEVAPDAIDPRTCAPFPGATPDRGVTRTTFSL